MKTLKTLATGLAVVGLLSVTSARASLVAVGPTVSGDSWAQGFNESGVTFDNIEVSWASGTLFEPPALRDFSGGWSALLGTSTSDTASGSALTSLDFSVNWVGTASDPTTFDFYAYDGNAVVDSAQAVWTGSEWDIGAIPVPEPTTMIAGALLLLPLGASTLRILRRNRMS